MFFKNKRTDDSNKDLNVSEDSNDAFSSQNLQTSQIITKQMIVSVIGNWFYRTRISFDIVKLSAWKYFLCRFISQRTLINFRRPKFSQSQSHEQALNKLMEYSRKMRLSLRKRSQRANFLFGSVYLPFYTCSLLKSIV
jgi:hypothetical protein